MNLTERLLVQTDLNQIQINLLRLHDNDRVKLGRESFWAFRSTVAEQVTDLTYRLILPHRLNYITFN